MTSSESAAARVAVDGTEEGAARVAVDAMGGDAAPAVVIEGAIAACRELGLGVVLVGPRGRLEQEPALREARRLGIELVDAEESVEMAEKVTRATLKKRSSILVGLQRVREGQADAFFSAGNTAACWTIARLVLGSLRGVDRPALATVVPHPTGRTVLLDVGANAECKARQLEEFAVMGDVYTRALFHLAAPRVGLMSLGQEEGKGNELTREVHAVLKGSGLNFIGNVEGSDLFSGRVDVIVMDGFTGNVVLKACEKLAVSIIQLLREELSRTLVSRVGAWLSLRALRRVRTRIDAAEHGGAPLLGVKGCCVVGHGRSNAAAIKHGIRVAAEFSRSGANQRIEEALQELAARREATPGVSAS
jgi:glycerol-3-phosphate acyltransferase PlsX